MLDNAQNMLRKEKILLLVNVKIDRVLTVFPPPYEYQLDLLSREKSVPNQNPIFWGSSSHPREHCWPSNLDVLPLNMNHDGDIGDL